MSQIDELKNLLKINRRRLQKLEETRAYYGVATPPHILMEIEDIEDDIERSRVPIDVVDAMYEKFITESTPEQLKEEGFELI